MNNNALTIEEVMENMRKLGFTNTAGRDYFLRKRLYLPSLNRVYLGESKVHGRGVFAKVRIAKGEIATLYPGDLLVMRDVVGPNGLYGIDVSDHVREGRSDTELESLYREFIAEGDYEFIIDDKRSIIGLPEFDDNPAYMAHFANDAAKSHRAADFRVYLAVSFARMNCSFTSVGEGCFVGLVATRDIEVGEELFVCYGPHFWLSRKGSKESLKLPKNQGQNTGRK